MTHGKLYVGDSLIGPGGGGGSIAAPFNLTELAVAGGTETVDGGVAPAGFDANPSVLYGGLYAIAGNTVSMIAANGGFAGGHVRADFSGTGGAATIQATAEGAHAQGRVRVYYGGVGTLEAIGNGGFAQGEVRSGGAGSSATLRAGPDYGCFASGYAGASEGGTALTTATYAGAHVQGYTYASGGVATVHAAGQASHASGYAQGYGAGTIQATGKTAFASGYARAAIVGAVATIEATGEASFAQGKAHSASSPATITSSGHGSFAQGYAYGLSPLGSAVWTVTLYGATPTGTFTLTDGVTTTGAIAHNASAATVQTAVDTVYGAGNVTVTGTGPWDLAFGGALANTVVGVVGSGTGLVDGYVYCYPLPDAVPVSVIKASAQGSFAQGYAHNGTIVASSDGSFAQGFIYGNGAIISSGDGAFAQGYSDSGIVRASAPGSFAQGYARSGLILASNYGSFAQGYLSSGGMIKSSGVGSFAQGSIYLGNIEASAQGSFAQGFADAHNIISSAQGSFAQGSANWGVIAATSINSAQFGPGTNAIADSLKVGSAGLHFMGLTSTPGSPTNGMMWTDGTDVFVRTGGVTKNMTNI